MRCTIPLLALIFLSGCATSPSTKFVSTFQQAFDTGNTNALLALVKWDGMPEELRSGMVWKLTNHLGKQRVSDTALVSFASRPTVPPNEDGRKLVANLQLKFWLFVTTESLAGISNPPPVTIRNFLIGTEDEKLLICGFRFDKP